MQARQVPARNGWQWIVDAFALFKRNPLMWLVLIVIYVVIAMLLSFIPVIGSLAFNLIAPVFLGGLMLGCQALEAGQDLEINHLFAGFKQNSSQLVTVGGMYLAGMILIMGIVFLIAISLGVSASTIVNSSATSNAIMSPKIAFAVIIAILVGMLLVVPLMMAYWFAPVLVVFNGMAATEAFKLSFNACLLNIPACLVCSLVAIGLMLIGMIPLGLGLIVVIPVMLLSLYTSYKDIFNVPTFRPSLESNTEFL